jgi:hypothetical protein
MTAGLAGKPLKEGATVDGAVGTPLQPYRSLVRWDAPDRRQLTMPSRGWSVLGPHGIGNRRFWLDTSGHDRYGQPQLGAPL